MNRTNEQWVADLQANGERQAEAMRSLQAHLERGLFAYFSQQQADRELRSEEDLQNLARKTTQNALAQIKANLHTYQGKSRFLTWASKIAARTVTNPCPVTG
jgi:RNA polymerase sigma-70 factor (ECF subfamily)